MQLLNYFVISVFVQNSIFQFHSINNIVILKNMSLFIIFWNGSENHRGTQRKSNDPPRALRALR